MAIKYYEKNKKEILIRKKWVGDDSHEAPTL